MFLFWYSIFLHFFLDGKLYKWVFCTCYYYLIMRFIFNHFFK
jgi:hypothetical protein